MCSGPFGFELRTNALGVHRVHPEGTREGTSSFGQAEARQIPVQPSTATRQGRPRIQDGDQPITFAFRDHPHQDGPLVTPPTPDTRTHRADRTVDIARCSCGEPDPWPSTHESTALAHSW